MKFTTYVDAVYDFVHRWAAVVRGIDLKESRASIAVTWAGLEADSRSSRRGRRATISEDEKEGYGPICWRRRNNSGRKYVKGLGALQFNQTYLCANLEKKSNSEIGKFRKRAQLLLLTRENPAPKPIYILRPLISNTYPRVAPSPSIIQSERLSSMSSTRSSKRQKLANDSHKANWSSR